MLEDLGYGNAMYWSGPEAPIHALWNAITMPALVLRARQEIMPGFGSILAAAEAERFAAAVPSARVAEIDANHYTITTHEIPSPPSVRSCARADPRAKSPRRSPDRRTCLVPSAWWLAALTRGLRRRSWREPGGYLLDFVAAMAWSTVSWMPKTFVSPVILKIFSIRSCVQTRSREPSCARTRFRPPTSTPEAGGVEELDLLQVDDELVVVLVDQIDEQLTEPRRRVDIDLALDVDDLDAVLVVVTQLQIHKSSSAMHGVVATSLPGGGLQRSARA